MQQTKPKFQKRNRKASFSKAGSSMQNRNGNKRRKKSAQSISPESLIRKSSLEVKTVEEQYGTFEDLKIDGRLKKNIANKGYVRMTEIQSLSHEMLMRGEDLVGIANTGTGKTGAFLIPLVNRMLTEPEALSALVLVPTRELALQVKEEFDSLTRGLNLSAITLIGGTSLKTDLQQLNRKLDLVIGTPGRTTDMMNRGAFRPAKMSVLILDEFDRMLDMGFSTEVFRIAENMKQRTQTILFSATENKKIEPLIDDLLDSPYFVKAKMKSNTSDNVDQDIIRIQEGQEKFSVLMNLIIQEEYKKVLIFSETKRGVTKLTKKLKGKGIGVDEIHGNRSQAQRKKALDKFRMGRIKVLTATDVAARGLDIDDISHVINYQLPGSMESYIHRIGRTGRAGKTGQAITLVD